MRAFTEAAQVPEKTPGDILIQTRQVVKTSTKDGARYQMSPSLDLLTEMFYFSQPQMVDAAEGESQLLPPQYPMDRLSTQRSRARHRVGSGGRAEVEGVALGGCR
jgi:hypothetical protein